MPIGIKIRTNRALSERMIAPTTFTEDALMSLITIEEVSSKMQTLLIKDAERLGRSSGFIKRKRKLSGGSFAQSLVFGWQANPESSLEELCQSAAVCGVNITPQGLQERLNSPEATTFMREMLEQSLTYLVEGESQAACDLGQFNGIYLQDSTTLQLPLSLASVWRASGNQTGKKAGMKVQTLFNYQNGRLQLRLAEAVAHDCPLQTMDLPTGSLRLADVGYFKVKVFETLNQRDVWWLTRLPARVGIWEEGRVVHIATWLTTHCPGDSLDVPVEITAQRFGCRLLAQRVPPEVAAQRREQVRRDAQNRSSQLRSETLALCEWTVIVTNLPVEMLSLEQAIVLLRLRWQIELLFKLWKSIFSLDSWRSLQPQQILTEIFAKLLMLIVQHWLLMLGCWGEPDRSLFKAAVSLRKHAFHLALVLHDFTALFAALCAILPTLSRCSVQKRKTRPSASQLLDRAFP
jgi:hypothetical protein